VTALVLDPTHVLVPGNRWDLLPPGPDPSVAVVVTHFEQHDQLARTLAALSTQTLRPAEVVVADDGSRRAPATPAGVRLVRQPDQGFRAAAARNLGAAATTADVLVFLDADTTPEPGFLRALVQRVGVCPDVLAVGRRRHADLSGDGRELPEPAWLADGLRGSRDLLDADGRSFRFVISAVLACSRLLYDDLGGFDERFVGYGGEDWDLGYRAWNNGAVLVHEPDAVAWHDGPEWSGRDPLDTQKDQETGRLAALIPEPLTRGAPLPALLPDVLVDVAGSDPTRCIHSLLRQSHRDLQVRAEHVGELHAGAVRTEPWTTDQLRRARVHIELQDAAPLAPHVVAYLVAQLSDGRTGELALLDGDRCVGRATATRATGRARRWSAWQVDVIGHCFGRESVQLATVPPRADLAGFLSAAWASHDSRPDG
jgi:hypothetical protein